MIHKPGHPDYAPALYPKALRGPKGTAVARDPGHEAELEKDGWSEHYVAPVASPVPAAANGNVSTPQFLTKDYVALQSLTKDFVALQNAHQDLKAQLAQAKNDLAHSESDRATLQLRLDNVPTQAKLKLQQDLDILRAQHEELKMSHRELLAVVTPQTAKA